MYKRKTKIFFIALLLLCLIVTCVSLTMGSYPLSLADIIDIIRGKGTFISTNIFMNLRVPRVMMGLYAGFVLGIAGAIYQIIFCNPLASPDLTGVASGASLGAACAIVIGTSHPFEMTVGAFVSGMLALLCVIGLVKLTGTSHVSSYILAGIIISSLADAGIMILKYMADPMSELAAIEFWTMGSLSAMTMDKMLISLLMGFIPLVLLCLSHRTIVMLSLGDENARYLGLNAKVVRILILVLTTWVVASIIAVTGVISFVGLIAPHIVYLMIKKRTGLFFVLSGLAGSLLIVIGDLLARILIPYAELPLSILTTFISVPVLIYWMYLQRGKTL